MYHPLKVGRRKQEKEIPWGLLQRKSIVQNEYKSSSNKHRLQDHTQAHGDSMEFSILWFVAGESTSVKTAIFSIQSG